MITGLFENLPSPNYFFNCGPKAMIDAVLPLELRLISPEKIYSSVDYMTKCGVGVCGSCADKKGRRTCIEGPFMNP
jgi:dihydroorotate dehydrogenase (NAD+) catalytic subunit